MIVQVMVLDRSGAAGDFEAAEKSIGKESESDDCGSQKGDRELLDQRGDNGSGRVGGVLHHERLLENLQVVVKRNGAAGDGKDNNPEQAGSGGGEGSLKSGDENVELAEEAGERRDP